MLWARCVCVCGGCRSVRQTLPAPSARSIDSSAGSPRFTQPRPQSATPGSLGLEQQNSRHSAGTSFAKKKKRKEKNLMFLPLQLLQCSRQGQGPSTPSSQIRSMCLQKDGRWASTFLLPTPRFPGWGCCFASSILGLWKLRPPGEGQITAG